MTDLSALRVAVLHEWFAPVGGSEQVALELARVLNADLWATWDDAPDAPGRRPRPTWWGRGPRALRRRPVTMALTPWIWRTTRAGPYDVVVTSSHGLGHTAKLPSSRHATYLSYVHTPARYVWSPDLDERGAAWYLAPARAAVKHLDRRMSRHVASYAANSAEVAARIRTAWDRDATVIPPPVDTDYFTPMAVRPEGLPGGLTPGSYLLAAGRWVPYKRFPRAVAIADRAGFPLVVSGGGVDEPAVRQRAATASVPVVIVSDPDRALLHRLYAGAAALLFPGREDFGMVPVEAQACGTPVVALDEGGARESVLPGVTGFLVADDLDAYAVAITRALALPRAPIRDHALAFSYARFDDRVRGWVQAALDTPAPPR